jgi:hypothetical protein
MREYPRYIIDTRSIAVLVYQYRWNLRRRCSLGGLVGEIPANFEPVERYYFRNSITPLLPVSEFRRLPVLKRIQPEYLTSDGVDFQDLICPEPWFAANPSHSLAPVILP